LRREIEIKREREIERKKIDVEDDEGEDPSSLF
jgi:hypothetical protein